MPDLKNKVLPTVESARISLTRNDLADAVTALRSAAAMIPGGDAYAPRLDAIENEYYYMLRFIASGNDVENAPDTVTRLSDDLFRIARSIELDLIAESDVTVFSGQLRYVRRRPEETLASLVSDYLAELDSVNADTAALTDTRRRTGLERIAADIFSRLWVEFPVSTDTAALLASLFDDASIPFYDRVLWVHALGLSALNYPDPTIINLLHDAHRAADSRVSTAAAIWLVFTAAAPGTISSIKEIQPDDALSVYIEFARALYADILSNNYKDTLGSRLNDLGRRVSDRLSGTDPDKIGDYLSDPSWLGSDMDSKDFDSIRDFAQAQANGDDVFASTLGRMRSFEFFNALPNWFLPFHTANSTLAPVVDGEGAMIADAIAIMPILCDSDKYALVLSMAQMPAGMRETALTQMTQQFQHLSNSDEATAEAFSSSATQSRRQLINNHIKNIYRFFKLFKTRHEFTNVFERGIDISPVCEPGVEEPAGLLALADALLRSRRYIQALDIYDAVLLAGFDQPDPTDTFSEAQLMHAAMAADKAGARLRACQYYEYVLARNPANLDAAMAFARISLCEDMAADGIAVLTPFIDDNTDNPSLLRLAGSLYEALGEWVEALNTYHNLDYILPEGDDSAKGRLAKALLFTDDYSSALPLFEKATPDPSLAYYHALALWLAGERQRAIDIFDISPSEPSHTIPEALADLPAAKSFALISEMKKYRADGRPM